MDCDDSNITLDCSMYLGENGSPDRLNLLDVGGLDEGLELLSLLYRKKKKKGLWLVTESQYIDWSS